MSEKYFHAILGSDTAGDGTAASPYKTYDKARAMAGSTDEVYGGGVGCGTWAKIRFCASDGNDSNDGLTPDRPKKDFAAFWNSLGTLTDDTSLVLLVKGMYASTDPITLTGGARRTGSYCSTNKMLRGYEGTDYFGSGKAYLSIKRLNLNACDSSIFRNFTMVDINFDGTTFLICGVTSSTVNVLFDNCDFLNIWRYCANFSSSPTINGANFDRCAFIGRNNEGWFAAMFSFQGLVTRCYFRGFAQAVRVGSASSGVVVCDTIFDRCAEAIYDNYIPGQFLDKLVFYNCGKCLSAFGYNNQPRLLHLTNSIFHTCTTLADVDYGNLILERCCLYNGSGVDISKSGGSDTTDKSLIGDGCFLADPQFIDPASSDFRLKSNSPCLNLGLSNPYIAGNVGHIGAEGKAFRGLPSRSAVYANVKQVIR